MQDRKPNNNRKKNNRSNNKNNGNRSNGNRSNGNRTNSRPLGRYGAQSTQRTGRGGKPDDLFSVHPISEKMILRGHPWITKDKFSAKFPENEKHFLIKVKKKNGQPLALCINDPKHKFVKARVWKKEVKGNYGLASFKEDLKSRIKKAVFKRKDLLKERDNLYLIFAEADELPGLRVLMLGEYFLISTYSYIWKEHFSTIIETLELAVEEMLEDIDPDALFERNNVWIQSRSENYAGQLPAQHFYQLNDFSNFTINEFGVKYNISLGKQYDHGLYTDMASIRKKMTPYFEKANKVLNLFSYTGAFSLFALKHGCEDVRSVDLSEEYLERVEKNIELNKDFDCKKHQSICSDTEEALDKLIKNNENFDLIICDPPSSFSDGSKRSSIFDFYESALKTMSELAPVEGNIAIFCNTQKFTRKKFEGFIYKLIKESNLPLKMKSKLHIAEDCPRLKGFPEGDYLKGIILKKVDPSIEKVEVETEVETEAESDDSESQEIEKQQEQKAATEE